ncbi:thioredoxin family protein [Desulfoplanes sp.]
MNKTVLLCLIWSILFFSPIMGMAAGDAAGSGGSFPAVLPVPGTVTMVELGAHACVPCKMMAPVMDKLEKKYAGRAAIVFIDVWDHPGEREKYAIRAIPTQIFFDHAGREVSRHVGFYPENKISRIMDTLLADQGGN